MGLFSGALEAIGLTPDLSGIAAQSGFNPVNIQSGTGSLAFDPESKTFTSQLSPELQQLQQGLFQQLGGFQQRAPFDTEKALGLLREQAAPFEEQQRLNLEQRLFKQGLTGASMVNRPGGARGSLFQAQQSGDLARQLAAQQLSQQQQTTEGNLQAQLMSQLFGIGGQEQGLFSAGQGFSQLEQQGRQNQANILMQQEMASSDLIGNLLGGAALGFATGGFGVAAA